MRDSTIAATLAIDLIQYLEDRGVPRARVLEAAGLSPERLADPDARFAGRDMEALWFAAERLSGDPDIGMHAAETPRPAALHILGYVLPHCRDAREVLDRLARYAGLLNDGLRVRLEPAESGLEVRFEVLTDRDNYLLRHARPVMEAMAVGVVSTLTMLTGSAVRPRQVRFRHASPASTSEHERLLGVLPHFAMPDDAVVLDPADADRPVRGASPTLRLAFEGHAARLLDALEAHGPVGRRVLAALAERMNGVVPELDTVARDLAMSSRTLQRSLKDEGTSFAALVDEVRRRLATSHLASREGTAAEVAFLLGFSDPSAFTRAFRRWTGDTPGAWRAHQRG